MRNPGLVIALVALAAFGLAATSSAQCTIDLIGELEALDVNGGDVEVGDVIEYSIVLQVPRGTGDPPNCTLYNTSVHFFPPPLGSSDPCEDCPAGTLINPVPVTLEPGARPFEWTSTSQPALRYVVQPEDAGATLLADACVRFTAEVVPPPPPQDPFWRCRSFSSALDVASSGGCLDVTKQVDCPFSKVGDWITYAICIGNCSDPPEPLHSITVFDDILGDISFLFPSELGEGETACITLDYQVQPDDPDPLVNTVTASGVTESGVTTPPVAAAVEVDLIHPSAAVSVDCLTDPVPPGGVAEFAVVFTNTGDCNLEVTTDPPGILPLTPIPPGEEVVGVTTVTAPYGAEEVCCDVEVIWTLPPGYCGMTDSGTLPGHACCTVAGDQGCEAGFWKVHPECWCEGHGTADLVGSVFVVPSELSDLADDALLDVFYYHGGGDVAGVARMLLRAGVAALLNACDEDISYPMSEAAVVDAVSTALGTLDRAEMLELRTTLQMYNSYGCPLDGHCQPIGVPVGPRGPQLVMEDVADVGGLPQGKDGADLGSGGAAVLTSAPNPFRNAARIQFLLPTSGTVAIDIYDAAGRHVASLMHDARPAGQYEVTWDGRNAAGTQVPTGVYFCKARLDGETLTEKMILVR